MKTLKLLLYFCYTTIPCTAGSVEDETCLLQTRLAPERVSAQGFPSEELVAFKDTDGSRVPEFHIDLDRPPRDRFREVATFFAAAMKRFHKSFGGEHSLAMKFARSLATARGDEESELMQEMQGISDTADVPAYFIQAMSLIPEAQSMRGPFALYLHAQNLTLPAEDVFSPERAYPYQQLFSALSDEILESFPMVGCTGIIAKDGNDGTVFHARNLDVQSASFQPWMQNLTYNAVFTRGGNKLYTASLIATSPLPATAMRQGSNGFAIEVNDRFLPNGLRTVFAHLLKEKRKPSGWIHRHILENVDNYEDAVKALSSIPYPSPQFTLVSGVKKGVILARDPDGLAYKRELGDEPYLLVTNTDGKIGNTSQAWLDTVTSNKFGDDRKLAAERIMSGSKVITPELLQRAISDDAVAGNLTVLSAVMNVERGIYSTILPHCKSCDFKSTDFQHVQQSKLRKETLQAEANIINSMVVKHNSRK